jgi:hypothetical protein
MSDIEDDDWLNAKAITCPGCEAQLEIMDQSPFDPDRYLYCLECPNRIDIDRYDAHWKLAEEAIGGKDGNKSGNKSGNMILHLLGIQFETMVAPCPCGGKFRYAAPRRCLYCACVIVAAEPHQHVWPMDSGDDPQALADGEALMARFTLAPVWVVDC